MQSSQVELKLQLGESLGNEIMKMANRLSLTPELWLQIFLAKGRLTPSIEDDFARAGIFFNQGAFNA